jgi:hypothetical protein
MKNRETNNIQRFGFRLDKVGAHTSRTIMLEDLRLLLSYIGSPDATKNDYLRAIAEENCLGKRSGKTRKLTAAHLVYLYSLDPSITVFRALLYFWNRDVDGQPLLALMCAYGRDSLLRISAPFILKFTEGETVSPKSLEGYIDDKYPCRFSKATLKSTAQNLNATWTKSGHLVGKAKKIRSRSKPTPGSVSYALFLGYLKGVRGEALFMTEYTRLLDCSIERAIELAEEASRRGWIVFKRVGKVVEVQFPNLLTTQEREWIRDQN